MGEMTFPGMSIPDYRAGDQVRPGSAIAQVIDAGQMDLASKIGEQDRGNVMVGQPAEVEFDALAGQTFRGTVKTVGGMSTRQFWESTKPMFWLFLGIMSCHSVTVSVSHRIATHCSMR